MRYHSVSLFSIVAPCVSRTARRQHVVAVLRRRFAQRVPHVAREASRHHHREGGRRRAPVEERVDVPEHALRAGRPRRTRADGNRAGSPWPAPSRPAARRSSTRRGSRRHRTARRRRRSAHRACASKSTSADAPPATSSHDAGPSHSAVSAAVRAIVFGATGSAMPNDARASSAKAGAAQDRPARSTRPRSSRSRASRRSPRRRSARASSRRSRSGVGQPRSRSPSGSMKQGGPTLHPHLRVGERRHRPQRLAVPRAAVGDERQRDPRIEIRAPAPRRHVAQHRIRRRVIGIGDDLRARAASARRRAR